MATIGNSAAVIEVESKTIQDKPKKSAVAIWLSSSWKAVLAELVATSMLLLFGCMSCLPIDGLSEQSPLYAPLGFGFTVLFNILIFGHLSGAHMNPAVTLAGIIWGNTSFALGVAYIIAQTLGATIGYGILVGLAPIDVSVDGICVTMPHHGLTDFQTLGIEIVLTGTLVLVCCGLWDPVNENKQDSSPIKFGLTIVGLSVAGGPLTGASMNPVRSLAPALWTGHWTAHWTYWAGPFIGATVVTTFYKFIFLKKQ